MLILQKTISANMQLKYRQCTSGILINRLAYTQLWPTPRQHNLRIALCHPLSAMTLRPYGHISNQFCTICRRKIPALEYFTWSVMDQPRSIVAYRKKNFFFLSTEPFKMGF